MRTPCLIPALLLCSSSVSFAQAPTAGAGDDTQAESPVAGPEAAGPEAAGPEAAEATAPPADPSQAAAAGGSPAPYAPYQGGSFPGPGPRTHPRSPAPLPEEPEFTRRSVELIPALGLAIPHCAPGDQSDARCSGVGAGVVIGLTALWRVTPMFAWGGTLEVAGFGNQPDNAGYSNARAGAAFIGLTGRVYFTEQGQFEPFVELGVGGGALGTQQDELEVGGGQAGYEETGAGPALRGFIGFDLHLSRTLRLGPALGLTQVFVDKIRRCRATGGGECADSAPDRGGHLDNYLQIVANLTFQFGSEL